MDRFIFLIFSFPYFVCVGNKSFCFCCVFEEKGKWNLDLAYTIFETAHWWLVIQYFELLNLINSVSLTYENDGRTWLWESSGVFLLNHLGCSLPLSRADSVSTCGVSMWDRKFWEPITVQANMHLDIDQQTQRKLQANMDHEISQWFTRSYITWYN